MLITIDKRGSINLPAAVRKELNLDKGVVCLDLTVMKGGTIVLNPVAVYPIVQLSEAGLKKIHEARKSGKGKIPNWLAKEVKRAKADAK